MKKILALAASILAVTCAQAREIKYVDAAAFPIYGKADPETMTRYERFPERLSGIRGDLVYLSRHSAGLYIRFRSDSPVIAARWTSYYNEIMNHQAPTGTRGLDLYMLEGNSWRNLGSARPNLKDATSEYTIIDNMDVQMREYMLYLPLYDGAKSIEIGIAPESVIEAPAVDKPRTGNPIVMYGTSILQGGCCARPGMAHTSIISRMFDREVINLGFSGNAFVDLEVAELMAGVENPAVYVLDYVPNASVELIDTQAEKFFRIIRDAHPDVPVIFVEDPHFATYGLDSKLTDQVDSKNAAQKRLFAKLRKAGEKKIYYLSCEGMVGSDGEAFVDGIHLTDLGMMRYVEHIAPVLKKAMKK